MSSNTDVFKYNTLFHPGDFYIFWNILVPASVLVNIYHCGLRCHEVGLLIALSLNPFILKFVLHSPAMAWVVSLFLIIMIHKVLRKWAYYNIYTRSFMKALGMLVIFIALPSMMMRAIWQPLNEIVEATLCTIIGCGPCNIVSQARDLVILCAAVALLLHSFYFYNCYNKCCKPPCPKPSPPSPPVSPCCKARNLLGCQRARNPCRRKL